MSDPLAPVIMVLGTASDVGKSVLVTALCRILGQEGLRVAPFKAQNMSNNADVVSGGEIGRAQSEQAAAAGIAPDLRMNPILLKPQGDRTSQLVVNGKPAGILRAANYREQREGLWPAVTGALDDLRREFDIVVAEGAGSPAEPNLQASDIVNARVARHAQATTLLVADIDRGGAYAHLLGTWEFLAPEDRALVRGFILNRFRGDPSLLEPANDALRDRTGVPVVGVIPWIDRLDVAQEDAVVLERARGGPTTDGVEVDIAAIRFPRVANFDDLDPLGAEPGVRVRWVEQGSELGEPDLIVLPGSKATVADLETVRHRGLDTAIKARAGAGSLIFGICGGLQMLGGRVSDPKGVEAPAGTVIAGLDLLPLDTVFQPGKTTERSAGTVVAGAGPWAATTGCMVLGYEIHMGQSAAPGVMPLLLVDGRPHGAVSADGRVAGAYLHGIFHNDAFRAALLAALGRAGPGLGSYQAHRDAAFDRLAAVVRANLDIAWLREQMGR